jgi:hypothetical protein
MTRSPSVVFLNFISIICITIIPQCGMHLHNPNEFITAKNCILHFKKYW